MILYEDSGHGGRDPGSGAEGVREKDLTLDIGNRMTRIAREQGIRVKRTRNGDITVEPNQRARNVRNSGANLCISNHINAGGGEGVEILISKYNDGKLANTILKELKGLGFKNRGIKKRTQRNGQDYYYMHRQTGNVTTLIVEYGFIDNKKDRDFISKPANREKVANAVVKAICKYYNIPFKDKVDSTVKEKPAKKEVTMTKEEVRKIVREEINKLAAGEDIQSWAKAAKEFVINNEIMVGYPDGSFKPNKPVSRIELAAIVERLYNQ